mmetsp:Transcript_69667/g.109962  ORF Transcript_69667/g.109962 Transcript_69667/m.109962 type:complete len:165 (-) Transcript_69667:93-587(-)
MTSGLVGGVAADPSTSNVFPAAEFDFQGLSTSSRRRKARAVQELLQCGADYGHDDFSNTVLDPLGQEVLGDPPKHMLLTEEDLYEKGMISFTTRLLCLETVSFSWRSRTLRSGALMPWQSFEETMKASGLDISRVVMDGKPTPGLVAPIPARHHKAEAFSFSCT